MQAEWGKIYKPGIDYMPEKSLCIPEKFNEVVNESKLKDNSELWMLLLESDRFEEIFAILNEGLKKTFFKKAEEIRILNNTTHSYSVISLIRKGELKEMKSQFLEIISGIESLIEL